MKILMIYENPFQALINIDSRVQRESESLSKAGFDVSFFLLFYYNDVEKDIGKFGNQNITILGAAKQPLNCPENVGFLRKIVWKFISSKNIYRLLGLTGKVLTLFKLGFLVPYKGFESLKTLLTIPTDVYHAHDYSTLRYARFCAWFNKKPFIYDTHEFWSGIGGSSTRNIRRFFESFHLSKAYAVISVSHEVSKILAKLYKNPKQVVVSNFPVYRELPSNRKLRDKINVSDNTPIVIYVGAFIPGRGVEPLLAAAKYLKNVKFVFMGFGMLKDKIINEIEKQEMKNVLIIDAVPSNEVIDWTSSADIGICTFEKIHENYYLTMPNKIGECLMAGIPVVVSDFPEMRKPVINDDVGVVCDPSDPKDIIRAIKELIEPNNYKRKKQNVLKVRKKYSWDNEEKRLIELYKSLKN